MKYLKRVLLDETSMLHGNTKDNENPPISPFFKGRLFSLRSMQALPSPPLEKGSEGGFEGFSGESLAFRRKLIRFFFVFVTLFVFCTPLTFAGFKDIDHKIAEAEIYKNIMKSNVRFTFRLQKGAFEKGVQQEMWDQEGNLRSRATSSGLKSLKRTGLDSHLISSQNSDINFKITEIKDVNFGMKFKQVKFTWQYESEVPSLWKRFIVAGGSGYAAFALRDDGWQYDGIELEYSEEPFPRTEKEIAEEQKEISQIKTAKLKEEERERMSMQERQRRIAESKKSTRDFGTFHLSRHEGLESCKVTDAGVACKKNENGIEKSYSIMFADIRSIKKNYYPGPPGSNQYSAIEIEKPDTQMVSKNGDGNKDPIKTSWRNVTQWISENGNEIDKFFDALTRAHKEWRKKFSDIAE